MHTRWLNIGELRAGMKPQMLPTERVNCLARLGGLSVLLLENCAWMESAQVLVGMKTPCEQTILWGTDNSLFFCCNQNNCLERRETSFWHNTWINGRVPKDIAYPNKKTMQKAITSLINNIISSTIPSLIVTRCQPIMEEYKMSAYVPRQHVT